MLSRSVLIRANRAGGCQPEALGLRAWERLPGPASGQWVASVSALDILLCWPPGDTGAGSLPGQPPTPRALLQHAEGPPPGRTQLHPDLRSWDAPGLTALLLSRVQRFTALRAAAHQQPASLPAHGIPQAGTLEWVAMPPSRGSF